MGLELGMVVLLHAVQKRLRLYHLMIKKQSSRELHGDVLQGGGDSLAQTGTHHCPHGGVAEY